MGAGAGGVGRKSGEKQQSQDCQGMGLKRRHRFASSQKAARTTGNPSTVPTLTGSE
jgi:hypothetical protein